MSACVFCDIVNGERPSRVVLQGPRTLTIMDANPVAPGHLLIVPKAHLETMADADYECLEEMIRTAKAMGALVRSRLGASGFNLLTANGVDAQQSILHLHFHVVPRSKDDGLNLWPRGKSSPAVEIERAFKALT